MWAIKIKWFPDGLIKGFKGWICAQGDQQEEGVDFFEMYAPVVQWTTIRLMSPPAFWKYLVEKMAICGMVQSKLDPCLFVEEKVICISYVDDLIF
jgi:hypothetical protein